MRFSAGNMSRLRRSLSAAALGLWLGGAALSAAQAQAVDFGVNLSGGKEPVKIDADNMAVHDKEGVAILTGNVSVEQGDRLLRGGKMTVYYTKQPQPGGKKSKAAAAGQSAAAEPAAMAAAESKSGKAGKKAAANGGLGKTGIDRLVVTDKVYIKNGKQIAVGDEGVFTAKDNVMILTGGNVILTDGQNTATGCRLTAHMDTGQAFLESCASSGRKGRVSVIVNRDEQNGQAGRSGQK